MNKEYALSRLAQLDSKIEQMEEELLKIRAERFNLKKECAKIRK